MTDEQLNAASPLVDEWIRSRGTSMDGRSYGAAVELAAFVREKILAPSSTATTETEQYKRMFLAACSDLGLINEALGLDPNDGGAEPILSAIAELKDERDQWVDAQFASASSTASVSEPDNSDAELGAYVRRLVQELSDSPKSFLYQVQRAISDQSQANSQAVALSEVQERDLALLAAYAEGSKSPEIANASRRVRAALSTPVSKETK